MRKLTWYSIIFIGYLQLYYVYDILSGSQESSSSFMAFLFFTPVVVLLVKLLKKGNS